MSVARAHVHAVSEGLPKMTPTGFTAPVAVTLPRALERLVAAADPVKVVLFGSYAYGRPTPDSDVDLLVVLDADLSLDDRYLLVSEALYPRQFPVDLIVLTPIELAERLERGNLLVADIMSRGLVLHERAA
jgi:predicted nucleotidyltransferase